MPDLERSLDEVEANPCVALTLRQQKMIQRIKDMRNKGTSAES